MFKDRIIVRKPLKGNKIGKEKKIKIDRLKYFKNKGAVSYCDIKDLKEIRNKGLIKSNKYFYDKEYHLKSGLRNIGIPQGSTISATLANIYMLDFDIEANRLANNIGGIYKRYSDDMVIVCPIEYEKMIIDHFNTSILQSKLEIQGYKTQIFNFIYDTDKERHYCFEKNINIAKLDINKNFEYLGFQFDGYYTLIRNASLSNYYRKMKKRFARSAFYTYHNETKTNGEVFKGGLYKSYTYKGSHRRRIYQKHRLRKDTYNVIKKHDWGNFITYTNLVSKVTRIIKLKVRLNSFGGTFTS